MDRGGTSWLTYLGVTLAYRRRGIAREMAEMFIIESNARGAHEVSLFTPQELMPAIKLFIGMGFTAKGKMRRQRYGVSLIEYSKPLD